MHFFEGRGYEAHTTAQVDGKLSFDVKVDGLPSPLHVESKRYAAIACEKWLKKAEQDALEHAEKGVPVVFMRQDRGEWMVLLRPGPFLDLLER